MIRRYFYFIIWRLVLLFRYLATNDHAIFYGNYYAMQRFTLSFVCNVFLGGIISDFAPIIS